MRYLPPSHSFSGTDSFTIDNNNNTRVITVTVDVQAAIPSVTALSPTSGPTAGGTAVVITGIALSGATAVTFGGTPATGLTVTSPTQITATSPAGAGTVNVQVTTPGGTSTASAADQFTYVAAPTVTSITPTTGPSGGGATVTITGTNLSGATAVTFGGTAATAYTVNSATQITATSPAGTGTVDVRVTTAGGTSATSAADQFTYVAAPTVTSISPTSGPTAGGTTVVISGTNLSGASAVSFGGTAATGYTINSATQITATSPAGTGTIDVRVTTVGGTSATSAADQFTYVAAPTVTSISPTSGPTSGGTSVVITGTNLAGASAVSFGSSAATSYTVNSSTQITATSPAGAAGTVDITVTTPGGTSATSASDQFTFIARPTVTAMSANRGSTLGGGLVTLTGTNFTDATDVSFGGAPAGFAVVEDTNIVVLSLPAHAAGVVNVTVTTAGGTSAAAAANEFTYVAPPTVDAVNPGAGPTAGGTTVILTGTSLSGATGVYFGATAAASFFDISDTEISATSPPGAGTVNITVETVGGTSATGAGNQFAYMAPPTVTSISPTSGPAAGGTTVVISGANLASASAVSFGGTAATGYTVDSATQITATSPAGTGTVDVRVTTAGGTSATSAADQFTYVAAPAVTSISPTSGPTAGGTTVVITGTTLSGATAVTFGATAAAGYTIDSATQITATSPAAAAGTVDIRVATTGGTSATSAADQFTYVAPPASGNSSHTVPANSTDNPIPLALTGGTPDSIATSSPLHGSVAVSGTSVTYTPTAGYSGSDSFTYTATNIGGTSASATVSITVSPPTLALSAIATTGQVTVPYNQTISASAGTAPYTFTLESGSTPNGVTLASDGTLSGIPTGVETANFTVKATDAYGATGQQSYTITVGAPVVELTAPATGSLPAGSVGASYVPITFTANGGNTPHSFMVSSGALPAGLNLSAAGVLSGTPTTVGTYNFSVQPRDGTAPGSGGPFTGAAVDFTIAIGSPRVTFVVQSAAGGTFAFSSPEPSLNVSVSVSGGTGTSGAFDVPIGSHPVSFTVPVGFVLASATCSDGDSTLDKDSQSGTLSVQASEDIVCTISAADTGPTEELIGSFLESRSSLIIANQPDTGRRLERLTGSYSNSGGVSGFGFAMSGQGMPLSIRLAEREASFAYSMRRSQSPGAAPSVSTQMPGRQGPLADTGVSPAPFAHDETKTDDQALPFARIGIVPEAEGDADPLDSRFDIWAEGKLARFNSSAGDGRFGILHAGADYLVSSRLLVGLGLQLDWTDLESDSGASIDGTGYLVGPYLTARLTETLYLDARAAWGQSSNTASPLGTYEDNLDGTRWLVSGALIGQYDLDRWRISPSARLTYFEEKTDEYTDGLGFPIPEVEIATGTFEFGPRISYRMELDNGMNFEPFVILEGIWTFEQKNTGASATSSPGLADEGLRGRAELGFTVSGGAAGSLSASGFYDGLGDREDFESWGGRLRFSKAF